MESRGLVNAWVVMEFAGVLSRTKRKRLLKVLGEKAEKGTLSPEEKIIWSAHTVHPDDSRARRKFIRGDLKFLEKRVASA